MQHFRPECIAVCMHMQALQEIECTYYHTMNHDTAYNIASRPIGNENTTAAEKHVTQGKILFIEHSTF